MELSNRSFLVNGINKTDRRPPPARHAAPSAPWPWTDPSDEIPADQLTTDLPPVPQPCTHQECEGACWEGYPQSRFPNWTPAQVERSHIHEAVTNYDRTKPATIYLVDVDKNGHFSIPDTNILKIHENNVGTFWDDIVNEKRPGDLRVRSFFIEDITGPVLKIFGAKYNIEPFFWSSSLHWIASRYQENPLPGKGDHITITLTFVKAMDNLNDYASSSTSLHSMSDPANSFLFEDVINTQAPLKLKSQNRQLVIDQMCVHLIRNVEGNTIISFHPDKETSTSAFYLQQRIRFAGRSVYWQNIFKHSPDPTFVLLTFLWHCLYAWDEALEALYAHICFLETQVISTSDMQLTQELHVIRAHHLHYAGLLEDFRKAVIFVRDTHNPAMDAYPQYARASRKLLEKESYNLLSEIERLEMGRRMQDKRLKNVMNLVFSSVNIQDSKRMQKMTEAAVRDSAAMKQIAYLTMIFLPASFVAAVFGMNIVEIDTETTGTLLQYVATAVPLTVVTIYAVVAFQSEHYNLKGHSLLARLAWPLVMLSNALRSRRSAEDKDDTAFSNGLRLST